MRVTASEIATALDGAVVGDGAVVVTGINSLNEAQPGDISFLANPKYVPALATTKASVVLVATAMPDARMAQIVVGSPDFAFAQVMMLYGPKPAQLLPGVHPTAVVGAGVKLGKDVAIGPHVVIGDRVAIGDGSVIHAQVAILDDAVIGAGCVLFPQVVVRESCRLGDRVILHPGVVVGSDGFGYATIDGVHYKNPQIGIVVIEDDVEIGANTTIDRARIGRTRIGRGTKIDNLVQIAHNVEIGEHCIIVAQAGIAGSTRLGHHVMLGGQCGIIGHIQIGDFAMVTAQSGVGKPVPPKVVMRGSPAQPVDVSRAQDVAVRRLRGTQDQVARLQERLAQLEARLAGIEARGGKP